ncbi:unnamed protein product [Candida verbasci]|uniref:Methyltransferase domain-containing protein n=1 Tax=Candida verbasci TaxID=1227364 RepID=A0A9W4TS13_9ASCO|nr:unnamed protein product [Candida verbasci]
MTRVTAKLIRQARSISPYLPPLLPANRSINQALLELKWIKCELPKNEWRKAVNKRLKWVPLQYILKTQPFGNLNILCKDGVLIPRWETEEWCMKLANLIKGLKLEKLSMIDACTGTGCISLLINDELKSTATNLDIHGFDVSGKAYDLAKENNEFHHLSVNFHLGDVFDEEILDKLQLTDVNLITSNPPYIPEEDYNKSVLLNGVSKSVKLHEPKLALVGNGEFYYNLLYNLVFPSSADGFVFELGYKEQADLVNEVAKLNGWRVGYMKDSAEKIRCVLGWKADGKFKSLKDLCSYVY